MVRKIGIALKMDGKEKIADSKSSINLHFREVKVNIRSWGFEAVTSAPSQAWLDHMVTMENMHAKSESIKTRRIGQWPELTAAAV